MCAQALARLHMLVFTLWRQWCSTQLKESGRARRNAFTAACANSQRALRTRPLVISPHSPTRSQLLRVCRRLSGYEHEDLYSDIHAVCLSRFLPAIARDTLDKVA